MCPHSDDMLCIFPLFDLFLSLALYTYHSHLFDLYLILAPESYNQPPIPYLDASTSNLSSVPASSGTAYNGLILATDSFIRSNERTRSSIGISSIVFLSPVIGDHTVRISFNTCGSMCLPNCATSPSHCCTSRFISRHRAL